MVSMLAIIVSSALVYSAPLIFTALGGTFSERSGVVNVGLEGIMTVGAFSATIFNLYSASTFGSMTPWISMLFGGLVGILFSLIHAVATINLRADHIVSGTVINLMAPGLTVFLTKMMFDGHGQTDLLRQTFGKFSFPILTHIYDVKNLQKYAKSLNDAQQASEQYQVLALSASYLQQSDLEASDWFALGWLTAKQEVYAEKLLEATEQFLVSRKFLK